MNGAFIQVRFKFLPDQQDFERQKWVLSSEAKDDAQHQILVGWKMVPALGQVRALLVSKALSVTPESLEQWTPPQLSQHQSCSLARDPRRLLNPNP